MILLSTSACRMRLTGMDVWNEPLCLSGVGDQSKAAKPERQISGGFNGCGAFGWSSLLSPILHKVTK